MSEVCRWLHEKLGTIPRVTFPFDESRLPRNGIYFLYEEDEIWGHDGERHRVVRVGTHRSGNFRNRIKEHYLPDEKRKMKFGRTDSKPSDRSIFRKNLGRALLDKRGDDYLEVWNIDFIRSANREEKSDLRDIQKERSLEREITEIIRDTFSFRFIALESDEDRMGKKGLEGNLIGTFSQCTACEPSATWLGNHSPKKKITESALWLSQHVNDPLIDEEDKVTISKAVEETLETV